MVVPIAVRLAQANRARAFHSSTSTSSMKGFIARRFIYRENRVPYYQRLFQANDGKRQWWKSHRSAYILYPYYTLLYSTLAATTYAMIRMVFGHKTWWGEG